MKYEVTTFVNREDKKENERRRDKERRIKLMRGKEKKTRESEREIERTRDKEIKRRINRREKSRV